MQTIKRDKIDQIIGRVTAAEMSEVDKALKRWLGLTSLLNRNP